jgi:uncharacterized protein YidB (DUF937 family)
MIGIDNIGLGELFSAIGGLGLASFALVDTTKVLRSGGISHSGFGYIDRTWSELAPTSGGLGGMSILQQSARDTLHANWINGMPMADQKAIAKSLLKLALTRDTAAHFASRTGVDTQALAEVADRMASGLPLGDSNDPQASARLATVFGRFDLALAAMLDAAYQRADQRYRNASKSLAALVALALAIVGGWLLEGDHVTLQKIALWAGCGILAVPLAPISKDLASGLSAAVKVAQSVRR